MMKQCKKCDYLKGDVCSYSNLLAKLYSSCPATQEEKYNKNL